MLIELDPQASQRLVNVSGTALGAPMCREVPAPSAIELTNSAPRFICETVPSRGEEFIVCEIKTGKISLTFILSCPRYVSGLLIVLM